MNLTEYCTGIANAIRNKEGSTEKIPASEHAERILAIQTGVELPELTNPATAEQIVDGYEAVDQSGEKLTGSIPVRSADDATVLGKTVQIPNGYYEEPVSVDVATVERGAPSIAVSSDGLISASVNQDEGYVDAGTNTRGYQLPTQSAKTVTPGTSSQTVVTAGTFVTGDILVDAISGGGQTQLIGYTGSSMIDSVPITLTLTVDSTPSISSFKKILAVYVYPSDTSVTITSSKVTNVVFLCLEEADLLAPFQISHLVKSGTLMAGRGGAPDMSAALSDDLQELTISFANYAVFSSIASDWNATVLVSY